MSALANFLARLIWWSCLWLMRRPLIKKLQRRSSHFFPKGFGSRARDSFIRQNRFARRNGVRIIAAILNLFFAYTLVLIAYVMVLSLNEDGFFTLPRNIAQRVNR